MLKLNGWLNGLTATGVVVFAVLFSVFFLYKSFKLKAKLLRYGSFMGIFVGLLWLGPMVDFLLLLNYNKHISDYTMIELYGILSYMWVAPAFICGIYVGIATMMPDKKKLMIIFIPIAILFEIILFIDAPNTFTFTLYEGDLIDAQFVYFSPAFILIAVFLGLILVFNGFGAIRMAIRSTGQIRTRFLYLALTFNLFVVVAVFDAFVDASTANFLFLVRLGMILCAWSMYLGLRG